MFKDVFSALSKNKDEAYAIDQDTTYHPFVVNVINNYKRFHCQHKCRICGSKDCRDCPFPLSESLTVEDFLGQIMDMEVFNENIELEKNDEQIRNDDERH